MHILSNLQGYDFEYTNNTQVPLRNLLWYMYLLMCWQGAEKTLILREVPFDSISTFRSNKDSLAQCDVAIFIYDRYMISITF